MPRNGDRLVWLHVDEVTGFNRSATLVVGSMQSSAWNNVDLTVALRSCCRRCLRADPIYRKRINDASGLGPLV